MRLPPSVVPWQSEKELESLKSWFYDPQKPEDSSIDLRPRAIQRVQAYQTRSINVPSEIVATAILTQALVLYHSSEPLVFRSSMTLALIRFVNSLLDPLQQRDKNLPLSVLASTAGLPASFVEVRHWGTHETSLPGAEILRDMGIRALEWLWHNYWNRKNEEVNFIQAWEEGGIEASKVVAGFQGNFDQSCERLVIQLGEDAEFEASRCKWDALITRLSDEIPSFPATFVDYLLQTLISVPSVATGEFEQTIKHPSNILSTAYHIVASQAAKNLQPDFSVVTKQCIHHPNTLAWELLKKIFDESAEIRSHFPPTLVNSIMKDSDEMGAIIPSKIEEIEKDMEALRHRLQETQKKDTNEDTEMWVRGWNKSDSTWTAQPMGVIL